MGQKSRWVLPDVIYPHSYRKFVICVPDEKFYIAAFQGLLIELTYSKNWQRDPLHKAAQVSRVWQRVLEDFDKSICDPHLPDFGLETEDGMRLRIKPTDPCIIQIECAPDEWSDWYNPKQCVPGLVSQPGADGELEPGECYEADVVLQGNGQWLSPVALKANYSVEITGASGGWTGGTVNWFCPDGTPYVLGACVGSGGPQSGDPNEAVDHMALVAQIDTDWYGAYNTVLQVPSNTVGSVPLLFQANDGDISDNTGSISFHVRICAAAETPCVVENAVFTAGRWYQTATLELDGDYHAIIYLSQPDCCKTISDMHIGNGWTDPGGGVYTGVTTLCDTTLDTTFTTDVPTLEAFFNGKEIGQSLDNYARSATPFTIDFILT